MEQNSLIIMVLVSLAILIAMIAVYYLLNQNSDVDIRGLMGKNQFDPMTSLAKDGDVPVQVRSDLTEEEINRVKRKAEKQVVKNPNAVPLEAKFFHAGMFLEKERQDFHRMRIVLPIIFGPALGYGAYFFAGPMIAVAGFIMGMLLGFQAPMSIMDRRILRRQEEIMYFLPLVIEQIAIGVSSSLDIGPCLQRVVQMADERDSHNVVTELVKHTQHYIRSGVSLEEAFADVGKMSGSVELKHAFMSIAQVAKHGGEVTKQLQELADAVASQRETRIEAKIKKLELEATGPVAFVFCGFLVVLLYGLGYKILESFN